jgi:hypothetical protein
VQRTAAQTCDSTVVTARKKDTVASMKVMCAYKQGSVCIISIVSITSTRDQVYQLQQCSYYLQLCKMFNATHSTTAKPLYTRYNNNGYKQLQK